MAARVGRERGYRNTVFVIQTDNVVRQQVWLEQQDLVLKYGLKGQSRAGHQITIAKFAVREGMEDTLMRWIQRICSNHRSFVVTLNNYSGHPPHTIYLRNRINGPFSNCSGSCARWKNISAPRPAPTSHDDAALPGHCRAPASDHL